MNEDDEELKQIVTVKIEFIILFRFIHWNKVVWMI